MNTSNEVLLKAMEDAKAAGNRLKANDESKAEGIFAQTSSSEDVEAEKERVKIHNKGLAAFLGLQD